MTSFGQTYPHKITTGARTHAAAAAGATACGTELRDPVTLHDSVAITCRRCLIARRDWLQPKHEAGDVAGMARRGMKALVRRAGAGDIEALRELVQLQAPLQDAITAAGRALHDGEYAYSYTLLAAELGVSRQAARQRFTRGAAPQLQAAGA